MKEEENVKKVYDQIHAPEALLGKVMEMKKDTFRFRNAVKYAFVVAAALVLTFVAGNGICYAATGESLIAKLTIFVGDNEKNPDITWNEDEDNLIGTFEMEKLTDDEPLVIVVPGEHGSVTVEETDDKMNVSVTVSKKDLEEEAAANVAPDVNVETGVDAEAE